VNSILPVTWNILFENPDSNRWIGSLDQPDSIIVLNDSTYLIGIGGGGLTLTLDTFNLSLTLEYWLSQTGQFIVSNVAYKRHDSKILAAAFCTNGYLVGEPGYPVHCLGGWVTIGGAPPPASISKPQQAPPNFTSRMLSDYVALFSFQSDVDGSPIRIFDLLGRERDEIRIAPYAQSIEYNTSRLNPGMYIATIGDRTTKFTVP
jgi:hypothetical protein